MKMQKRKQMKSIASNNPEYKVREVVASKGYELDTLIDDPDEYIRAVAKVYKNDPSLLGYIGVVSFKQEVQE